MQRSGITELEVLLAVAHRQSFRAAARELGMSATAVSNAVAGLEARLNVRLFNRTTRSVALTEAGQRYVERIAPAVAEIQRASEEVATRPEMPSGTLRINAPRESVALLFDIFETFLKRYPSMRLDITTESRLVDIVAEGYDAGNWVSQGRLLALLLNRTSESQSPRLPGVLATRAGRRAPVPMIHP